MVSGIKDEAQDRYIKDRAYNNTALDEEIFKIENETELQDNQSIQLNAMDTNNSNIINLLDDFSDENGTFMEYFSDTEYELFNDSVYDNYLLEEMGNDYLIQLNDSSNISISITDENEISTESLRYLEFEYDYPFYGQSIVRNVKDLFSKSVLGVTMKSYEETTYYPHNGTTIVETNFVLGSQKININRKITVSNSHILTRNKCHMTNDLLYAFENIREGLKGRLYWLNNKFILFNNDYYNKLANLSTSLQDLPNFFDFIMDPFNEARKTINSNLQAKKPLIEEYCSIKYNDFANKYNLDRFYTYIKDSVDNFIELNKEKSDGFYNTFRDFINRFLDEQIINEDIEFNDISILYEMYDNFISEASSLKNEFSTVSLDFNMSYETISNDLLRFNRIYQEINQEVSYSSRSKKFIEEVEKLKYVDESLRTNFVFYLRKYLDNSNIDNFLDKVNSIINFNLAYNITGINQNIMNLDLCLNNFSEKMETKISNIDAPYKSQINIMKSNLE